MVVVVVVVVPLALLLRGAGLVVLVGMAAGGLRLSLLKRLSRRHGAPAGGKRSRGVVN